MQVIEDIYAQVQTRCSSFWVKAKIQAPKPGTTKLLFRVFFSVSSIHGKGCLRWKTFPPKNLEKYKVRALKLGMRQFSYFTL